MRVFGPAVKSLSQIQVSVSAQSTSMPDRGRSSRMACHMQRICSLLATTKRLSSAETVAVPHHLPATGYVH